MENEKNKSRLDTCGWNSFRPELFFEDEGRKHRDIGDDILRIIKKYHRGDNILELCSGGGRLLIHLARAGLHVTGIDLSKDMLNICQKNIEREEKSVQDRIKLVHDDMCTFNLHKTFNFIILEDDGFMYLLTREDQLSCLHRIRAHLSEDGLFFLSFATPQKELSSSNGYEYDSVNQIKTQVCTWNIIDKNGKPHIETQGVERRRMTHPDELEQLLTMSQLSPIERWGDMQMHPFTDPFIQEYNYLIKK